MNDTVSSHHAFPSHLSFLLDNPLRKLTEPPTKVLELLNISKNDVIIDFGCGTGYYTIPLARQAEKTIGIDVQPGMLKKAEKLAEKHGLNIEFLQSDGTQIPLPDSMADLILLIRVFHEVEDKIKVLKEFKRILKKEGRVVIMEKTKKRARAEQVRNKLKYIPFIARAPLIGPPIIKISDITKHLENGGLKVINFIEIGSETLIFSQFSTDIKE